MRYVSTRGKAPVLGFSDTLLAGLAEDGGLYLPESWPEFSAGEIRSMRGLAYHELALRLIEPFVGGEIGANALRAMVNDAYGQFHHPAVCPIVQVGPNAFVLELFHGPTLAFKDVAMQLLARLMDHVLAERNARATIVGATSGDTGGAAIEAFGGRERIAIHILYPHGRVSEVQRRQMTTSAAANVHALAIEGTFDDCQALVKAMFSDLPFRQRMNLSGVNSINWARIMAQIPYYFSAALSLGAPDRPVSFTVPTGNFGDIFAGYAARRMGLPIERLVIATNENDILARTLETGRYETRTVVPTSSPSMDIQVSSNFERLLFEASLRDSERVTAMMEGLRQSGAFTLDPGVLDTIRGLFDAGRADEEETAATIHALFRAANYLCDPHTAVGLSVAGRQERSAVPMVTLSTAHPAKFPDAVKAAAGIEPALPVHLAGLMTREERFTVLPPELSRVETHIESATAIEESS